MIIQDRLNNLAQNTSFVKDVNAQSFASDVLETSQEKIVLVDFWAPWCGPCKQLTPLLERVISGHHGKIILAKINIDENAELAAQLRVQSVPTVYAFFRGQPVDAFMGNVSEQKLEQFLNQLLELTKIPGTLNLDEALKEAQKAFDISEFETAARLYTDILSQVPNEEKALAGLAHCYLFLGHAEQAKGILTQIPEDKRQSPQVTALICHQELLQEIQQIAPILPENHLDKTYRQSLKSFEGGDISESIRGLLEIMRTDKNWREGEAKSKLLKVFASLGDSHSLTNDGRRKLSTLLFS